MNKLPQITLAFWVMEICATTLLSMILNVGYAISSLFLISLCLVTLLGQLASKRYVPWLYWLVILSISTAGSTLSDFMGRTLGLGYATGSAILAGILVALVVVSVRQKRAEQGGAAMLSSWSVRYGLSANSVTG